MIYRNTSIDAIMALESQRTENYIYLPKDVAAACESCGSDIYEGEDYLECDNSVYCRKCIMAMTSEDVVELLGYKFRQAHANDM